MVRINPNEVHIQDIEFFDILYEATIGYDKPASAQYRFGAPYAAFSTPEHEIHKRRRAAISPFFSKKRIFQHSNAIRKQVEKLCHRLSVDFKDQPRPLLLKNAFTSYAADVITQYTFGKSYGFLDDPDFQSEFILAIQGFKAIGHLCNQFPWLARLLANLPDKLVQIVQPSMATVIEFQKVRVLTYRCSAMRD